MLPLVLTQCIDPMYGGGPGYGPGPGSGGPGGYPYNDPYRRSELREQGADLNRMAYERGLQDGRDDAQQRQSQNFNRHRDRFDRSTEMAYRDGYNQSYSQANSSLGAYSNPGSGYGTPPSYTPPLPTQNAAPAREPSYNMGYDYGIRDLSSGRGSDPGAHVGRYDPRYRSSFERGYYDAFNSRSGQNSSGGGGGGGGLWFR